MDENRLPELPQEAFRPMIAQSVQLEQFLGEELIFCFRDLDGVHTFTTCYGDIYKTVNALRDYIRLLESVCDQWELTGFHRATYEYHAEKLRKIDKEVCLIFVTSLAQYAIRGYEVSALDFIVKPVSYELFKIRMERAISLVHKTDYYTIKTADGIRKININNLMYIESNKHYLYFHTTKDVCRMRGTMKEISESFENKSFAFISGSLLVNLSYVEEMYGNTIKIGEEILSIARMYKMKFREKLAGYLGGIF